MDGNSPDLASPVFAYGVLQPGELGWLRVRDAVLCAEPAAVEGTLRIRDGLLLLAPGHGRVHGWLIVFHSEKADEGYQSVADLEKGLYRWDRREVVTEAGQLVVANVLIGRSPTAGSHPLDDPWTTAEDPLFREGRRLVDELATEAVQGPAPPDPTRVLRLQTAYGLLWSIIERYVTIRYDVGEDVWPKLKLLAEEPAFATALARHVDREDVVLRSTAPSKKAKLIPTDPKKSLDYYYTLRSNAAHRGKAAYDDLSRVSDSLSELPSVFDDVFRHALQQAITPPPAC